MVEDEGLVVDEDAVEQKPDEEEDDRHGPHRPERRLHVLAVPRPERDEAQHDDPENEKLVLHLDRHVCDSGLPARYSLLSVTRTKLLPLLAVSVRSTVESA